MKLEKSTPILNGLLTFFHMTEESNDREVFDSIQHSVRDQIAKMMDDDLSDSAEDTQNPEKKDTFEMTGVKEVVHLESESEKEKESEQEEDEVPTYTDEELEEALKLFKSSKTLPPVLMKDSIIDYAKRRSLEFLAAEDYDSAEKMDQVVADLYRAYHGDQGNFDVSSITKTIESRIESVKSQRQQYRAAMEQKMKELKAKEETKLAKLLEIHEQEKAALVNECQSREFLARFSKPSAKLLQLKEAQKKLALAHDFEGAKNAKALADKLMENETKEAQKRAMDSVKLRYEEILEKQQKEVNCQRQRSDRKVAAIESSLEKSDEASAKVIRQLEMKLKEAKVPKRMMYSPGASPTKGKPPMTASREAAKIRNRTEAPQLDIKINMAAVIAKSRKPK